jgi:hypothetical protein
MRTLIGALLLLAVFAGGFALADSGLLDVDAFTRARMATSKSEDFTPYFTNDAGRKAVLSGLSAADPAPAIADAKAWLAKLPVDMEMLRALAGAELRAGRYADSFRHRSEYYGLLASLAASGEGSEEKPWKVIAVAEEYVLLGELGATPGRQALTRIDGRPHDRMTVTIDGEERVLYFDVSLSFEAMERALGK